MSPSINSFSNRFFAISATIFLVGIAFLIASAYLQFVVDVEENPLRYPVPQDIVGTTVLHQGNSFPVHRLKCNDGDTQVSVLGQSDWRQLGDDGGFKQGIPYRASSVPLVMPAHECNEREGLNEIPLNLPLGRWVLEGEDCITPKLTVCRPWFTEPFDVVAR